MMIQSRRDFMKATGSTGASLVISSAALSGESQKKKRHIVTLSFDDGFKKSSIKTAEIYEKHKLSACINVVTSAHMKDFRPPDYHNVPRGDFGLWNELQARGHEVMPHSYKHANLRQLPSDEAKGLILRCLDVFSKELKDFEPRKAICNFAYNASTPELEKWLPTKVRAFRTRQGLLSREITSTCPTSPVQCGTISDRWRGQTLFSVFSEFRDSISLSG